MLFRTVVGSYFSYLNLLSQVQAYRSVKFVKKIGQVPYSKFAKHFKMVRPRNLIALKYTVCRMHFLFHNLLFQKINKYYVSHICLGKYLEGILSQGDYV